MDLKNLIQSIHKTFVSHNKAVCLEIKDIKSNPKISQIIYQY